MQAGDAVGGAAWPIAPSLVLTGAARVVLLTTLHRPLLAPMRSELKQSLSDTAVLWALLLGVALVDASAASGFDLPLLQRTTFWRMREAPLVAVGVGTFTLTATLVLAEARRRRATLGIYIAGMCGALMLTSFGLFDPGLGAAFGLTSRFLFRRHASVEDAPAAA